MIHGNTKHNLLIPLFSKDDHKEDIISDYYNALIAEAADTNIKKDYVNGEITLHEYLEKEKELYSKAKLIVDFI